MTQLNQYFIGCKKYSMNLGVYLNIHVDVVGNLVRAKFLDLLEAMDLLQHVTTPTHESGQTLDLIITRQCDALVKDPPVSDYRISDHWSVTCRLNLDKPIIIRKTKTFRKIKNIDTAALSNELAASDLRSNTPDDLNDLVHCFNTTLVSALDRHAPLVTRSIPVLPLISWFNNDIKEVRKERRNSNIQMNIKVNTQVHAIFLTSKREDGLVLRHIGRCN